MRHLRSRTVGRLETLPLPTTPHETSLARNLGKPLFHPEPARSIPCSQVMSSARGKLAPEVNRALFVKNLSYNVSSEDLFELFSKFGPIRQIRQGIASNTKGTAFVVYEDATDAKSACDKLNGFNFQSRYLVVLYHQPEKMANSQAKAMSTQDEIDQRRANLEALKQKHGVE